MPELTMLARELVVVVTAVALVTFVTAGGKSALLPAGGSSVVGWEPRRDQKWVGGQKDPEILVWRGGEEGKQTQWQHGGEEGPEQTHHAAHLSAAQGKSYRLVHQLYCPRERGGEGDSPQHEWEPGSGRTAHTLGWQLLSFLPS